MQTSAVCFVVRKKYSGTSRLRAYQISAQLQLQGFSCRVVNWSEINSFSDHEFRCYKIYFFVKYIEIGVVKRLKSVHRRSSVVFDPIDNYELEVLQDDTTRQLLDAVVAVSNSHKMHLELLLSPRYQGRLTCIPHHHSNFYGYVNDFSKRVEVVGFQGDIANEMSRNLVGQLVDYCQKNDLSWREYIIQNIANIKTAGGIEPFNKIIHEQLNTIDIGVIFPSSFIENGCKQPVTASLDVRLKPATRLVNMLSHGMPVICYPYLSYVEACWPEDYPLFCKNTSTLIEYLHLLATDEKFRIYTSNLGLTISRRFSIEVIVGEYTDLIGLIS